MCNLPTCQHGRSMITPRLLALSCTSTIGHVSLDTDNIRIDASAVTAVDATTPGRRNDTVPSAVLRACRYFFVLKSDCDSDDT